MSETKDLRAETKRLSWWYVVRDFDACGGYGCHGYQETAIVAAPDVEAAFRWADDMEANAVRVWPLDLPDIERKRTSTEFSPKGEPAYARTKPYSIFEKTECRGNR